MTNKWMDKVEKENPYVNIKHFYKANIIKYKKRNDILKKMQINYLFCRGKEEKIN